MSETDLPEKLRLFIFQYIDSVEVIEVLIHLKSHSDQWQTADDISRELRSNRVSVLGRLNGLKKIGIIEDKSGVEGYFRFSPKNPELEDLVRQLLEEYRVRRHKLLGLIFSPTKEARKFANAFMIGKAPGDNGGDHG